ncbi:hypothetical protein SMACR_02066 [Sordaria macrospora]|uniref:WGS project CABT00000000 data, contig 2.18 n=2 Tax=Sordaria macrospora TaxID=5147 RepID=F7W0V6_SORMK|nr:uncharacterized protein SMAC_02066 [Sordaria macrospora k-hell]KAA8632936.1 hypothetical protein SMACR_02066 [Sordaria macrospora]KAH7629241.1 hypothetical protein B0T09DRAFT_153655 [Sordaria sp. MPI-SDFR-AT-0083]WPJ63855.1 hypothetical protein SMAC4_02066 [Sordaria macrospora]CCC11408.1 unnamed protein product [Sordaria macrospora k-hell]
MSTTTAPTKSILFISATGGIALSTLKRCLAASSRASLTITVLARFPTRLQGLLSPTELASPSLRIIEGNAHSTSDIIPVLTHPSNPTSLVDIIVTGIGAKPDMKNLTVDDPSVCEKGAKALMEALGKVQSTPGSSSGQEKPYIIAISAAGASTLHREYPLALYPVHALLLKAAIKDKRAMERVLIDNSDKLLDGKWTVIRPSMLTNKPEIGLEKVRVATEDLRKNQLEGEKVVGYTISREDVGKWIFERLAVGGGDEGVRKYLGRAVVLSY